MSRIRIALVLVALCPLTSSRAVAGNSAMSDRETLTLLADQAVQALLADDASHLPLAKDFRYTENGQALDIGDGMWGTLTAYAGQDPRISPAASGLKFRLNMVDASKGEILALRATDEHGTGGILGLRLRVEDGKIADMEVVAIRHEYLGQRGGTVTLLQPMLLQMFDPALLGAADPVFMEPAAGERDKLIAVANAYFDGQEAGRSAGIPFSPNCARRDNGHLSTGVADSKPLDADVPAYKPWSLSCSKQVDSGLFSYIEKVGDRRFVVDADHGVVAAIDVMDVPGTVEQFTAKGIGTVRYPGPRPDITAQQAAEQFSDTGSADMLTLQSMLTIHLFKIKAGKIVRMDSFSRGVPYGFLPGWPRPTE